MARIPRLIVGNMIYHVLNRANGREEIFKKEEDYQAFEEILLEARIRYPIRILAFCLMPNHWHFILHLPKAEELARFMRWITHTHTQRWHAHYRSVGYGHVYQGRYKSFPIEKDDYLIQACRYVERNPLRAGLVSKAEDWRWSSLWIREGGTSEQKKLLADWPVERPDCYLEWVNTLQLDEELKLEKIRMAVKRGRPYGKDQWIKKTAQDLGLGSTLISRGRPKKGT